MLENKKSYIASIILCSVGVMTFVCMIIATDSLVVAKDNYYAQCRLADLFAKTTAIPKDSVDKLRLIDGIKDVLARKTVDARVIMPDSDKIIILRLISVDPDLSDPLNKILYQGNGFHGNNDIMIGNSFFAAHNLATGDNIRLIINGQQRDYNICASAQSPEFVYTVKEGESLPDPETWQPRPAGRRAPVC
jgi:putative ABC transport system permease protein